MMQELIFFLMDRLFMLSVIINILLLPLGIYVLLNHRKKLNLKIIIIFFLIFLIINTADLISTIYCYRQFGNIEAEINPLAKFLVNSFGYFGFIIMYFSGLLLMFAQYSALYFLLSFGYVKLLEYGYKRKKRKLSRISRFLYKHRKKVGEATFIFSLVISLIIYIYVPISNYNICSSLR